MTPDDLDKQIRAALGGEPSAGQLARLERFWREQSRAERRRRLLRRAAAAAASIVAIAAMWLAIGRRQAREISLPEVVVEAPRAVDQRAAPAEAVAAAPPAGREPTAYERMMFALQTGARATPEQALATRLNRATDDDERRRVIQQVGEHGSRESLAALMRAAERPAIREEALAAAEQIMGVGRLAEGVPLARDAAVRRALVARLLAAPSPAALRGFLALAADPATRGETLAAAAAVEQLPVAALVATLDGGDKQTRLAAAMVLGHVNGPTVSDALIARVSQSQRAPIEAWVALLACRGAPVDRFLAQAVVQPRLLGQVNSARAYWARVVP